MKVKKNLANKANYGGIRSNIKWIVIHYTANDGDTDEANGNYFKNNIVKASAHYFVDDDSVTQSVPDNYVAYSVGGSKWNNGGGKYYGKCTNSNSISIELCDDVKNGKVYPSKKTIENAIELTKELMKKYDIDADHVIRHYDVNGKTCPAYWVDDKKWKTEFHSKLTKVTKKTEKEKTSTVETKKTTSTVDAAKSYNKSLSGSYTVTATSLKMRKGAGTSKGVITSIPEGKKVRCHGYYTRVNGVKWLYVTYGKYMGFCSSEYLKK